MLLFWKGESCLFVNEIQLTTQEEKSFNGVLGSNYYSWRSRLVLLLKEPFLFYLHLACKFYTLLDYVDLDRLPQCTLHVATLETNLVRLHLKCSNPPVGWGSTRYIYSTIFKATTLAANFGGGVTYTNLIQTCFSPYIN